LQTVGGAYETVEALFQCTEEDLYLCVWNRNRVNVQKSETEVYVDCVMISDFEYVIISGIYPSN
jgi:hypothetical protein